MCLYEQDRKVLSGSTKKHTDMKSYDSGLTIYTTFTAFARWLHIMHAVDHVCGLGKSSSARLQTEPLEKAWNLWLPVLKLYWALLLCAILPPFGKSIRYSCWLFLAVKPHIVVYSLIPAYKLMKTLISSGQLQHLWRLQEAGKQFIGVDSLWNIENIFLIKTLI